MRHAYIWWPEQNQTCGRMHAQGGEDPLSPGTQCTDVPDSDGKEPDVMSCCRAHADDPAVIVGLLFTVGIPTSFTWYQDSAIPFVNDCFNQAENCLNKASLSWPPSAPGRLVCCS
jgi:hypothetical protein